MPHSHSIAQQSESIFHRFSGIVTHKDGYTLVKTPSNPTYFGGHYLILDSPPEADKFTHWEQTFRNELPDSEHLLLSWRCPDNQEDIDVSYFSGKGYDISHSVYLTAKQFREPEQLNHSLTIRKIISDDDWSAVLELDLLQNKNFEPEKYRTFATTHYQTYREMTAQGLGDWYGAFLNDQLVGHLGLYYDGEIGRFQNVVTHPDFRRQGICKTLVYSVSTQAKTTLNLESLVLEADEEYIAANIYKSLGYEETERTMSVCWYDKTKW
ncbi:hypothetical protein CS022_22850 [Veronia nyctiphanis]|uniref:N-acetyltransferase domain-containing protein n=1 Tax=Veronia nyctiphanis TaxID=1278244 RepID=A0A4Q0YJL3_9GAMM|nr:GNAT family N-acetyltransferase [Veronia nyctiphanis]RXJ70613.1 hypothetical protein CS022_22850 [Veronia nyctiphanis]